MTNERQLELTEAHQDEIRDQRIKTLRDQVPAPGELGPTECMQCLEPIPVPRRKLGYKVCISCAELAEARSRHRR